MTFACQELTNVVGDLVGGGVQCEMPTVNDVHLGVRDIALDGVSLRDEKRRSYLPHNTIVFGRWSRSHASHTG